MQLTKDKILLTKHQYLAGEEGMRDERIVQGTKEE